MISKMIFSYVYIPIMLDYYACKVHLFQYYVNGFLCCHHQILFCLCNHFF